MPQSRYVEAGGHRAVVSEAGAGPPIVLLASMLVLGRTYLQVQRDLARNFRVILVEAPGSGRASRLIRPWSFEDYARWLIQLLDALNLDRTTLIGHSNSGAVTLLAAAQHPQRISHLILADTVGGDCGTSLARLLLGRAIDCVLEIHLSLAAWHQVVLNALFHPRNFFHLVGEAARIDLANHAPRVTAPTLLAWGRHDHTLPLCCADAIGPKLRRSLLYVSNSGSHDWIVERPAEFARVVERFLASER